MRRGPVTPSDRLGRNEPTMAQPITLRIPCRNGPGTDSQSAHDVTLNPDWSVDTPHDLAAESVAVAFGGRLSCLELGPAIDAARYRLALDARRAWHPLRRGSHGTWIAGASRTSASIVSAAAYVRSDQFVAATYGTHAWLVAPFARALPSVLRYPSPTAADLDAPHPFLEDPDARQLLWDVGIHPASIDRVFAWVGGAKYPISTRRFTDLAYADFTPRQFRRLNARTGSLAATAELLRHSRPAPRLWRG